MVDLPAYVTLAPGEQVIALIQPDLEVQILRSLLAAVIGLTTAIAGLMVLDLALGRPLSGMRSGLWVTFGLIFGPIFAERLLAHRAAYVLTNHGLIMDAETAVSLRMIRRVEVWPTSLSIRTEARRFSLRYLANPPAVAGLIVAAMSAARRV